MCPELYVQHVATYRNGESEAGYWGEVDPTTHKVCWSRTETDLSEELTLGGRLAWILIDEKA